MDTNRYLRLIHRHRLVVPPGTNVKVTTRYLRLIHRFHPSQRYRYVDEPVLLGWTFGLFSGIVHFTPCDVWLFFSSCEAIRSYALIITCYYLFSGIYLIALSRLEL